MVDPIYTYVGGIAFLVLIIGTMLYLTFSTLDIDEGDEYPSESVVKGVGVESADEPEEAVEDEDAAPEADAESEQAEAEAETDEETEEVSVEDAEEPEEDAAAANDEDGDGDASAAADEEPEN